MYEVFSSGWEFIIGLDDWFKTYGVGLALIILVAIIISFIVTVADFAWQKYQRSKGNPYLVRQDRDWNARKAKRKKKWQSIKKWKLFKLVKNHFLLVCSLALFMIAIKSFSTIYSSKEIWGFTLNYIEIDPRDIGFLFAGLFAPSLAILGYYFSNRRNQTAQEQVKVESNRNLVESNRNLNDRFTKAIELLGDKDKYKQLGGIASLKEIGTEQPHNQFTQACADILIDFIRTEATSISDAKHREPINYQAERAFHALCAIQVSRDLEKHQYADLSHCNLTGLKAKNLIIENINLSNTYLIGANLRRADLIMADLTRANLSEANLSGADLSGTDLSGANLREANLSQTYITLTDFGNCKNLTLEQIESAEWQEDAPPKYLPYNFQERLIEIGRMAEDYQDYY